MTNLSGLLKKYNCIPIQINTNGGFTLNVKGKYDEEEPERSFLFSEFVYINDIPSLMNTFNDFAAGSKMRLNTHFRMEFEKELHWAYLCCEKSDDDMTFDGVLLDVYEYMDCIPNDNVINDFERRQSKKISELNKNGATLEEIYGCNYLKKIQQPFSDYGNIDSAIFDETGKLVAAVIRENIDFSPERYQFFKSEIIRFNHKDGGVWCIGTNDESSFNNVGHFLSAMCENLSRMTDSFIMLYNEKQNSKSVNKHLGANVEQQMLLNSIHSVIMEEAQAESALDRVLETVGNYLKLERISVYCSDIRSRQSYVVSSWESDSMVNNLSDSYIRKNYSYICDTLGETENYFSRGSESQLKELSLGAFAVSEMCGFDGEKALLFYESYNKKKWSYEDKRIIRSISQSVSNIIHRCEMDRKIKEKNDQLFRLAFYDNMLEIKNRAKLDIDMSQILSEKGKGIVMAVHIVNTRSLNEVFGQGYTDRLLKMIVQYLKNDDIGGQYVYRYSGSIMLIILNDYRPDEAQTTAQKILDRFEQPFIIDNVQQYAEAAIGVAVFDESVSECEDLYRAVTLSLYRANEYGRNSFAFFNHEFRKSSGAVYNLEQELRRCIADGMKNFELTYQPVFTGDGIIHHYETLLRWKSENSGYVSPRVFMRLMEKVGLDTAIDFWVIPRACEFCKKMQQRHGENVRVSVNLTVHDLQGGSVSTVVQNALDASGLKPSSFIVEIPESSHLLAYNETSSTLGKLKKLGIQICIDSFGNEYLPLNTLKFSYIDIIKVSSSFITNSGDSFDEELVRTTVYLANSRNIEIIVKNIEYKPQLEAAASYGLNIVQGGFMSPPRREDEYFMN